MKLSLHKQKENLVYLIFWLGVFAAPVFTAYVRGLNGQQSHIPWFEVFEVWKLGCLFLLLFLIHNFLVAPLLVYRNKKKSYFAMIVLLTAVFVFIQCQRPGPTRLPLHGDPIGHNKSMPPTDSLGRPTADFKQHPHYGKGYRPHGKNHRPHGKRPIDIGFNDFMGVILLLSLLGLNLGIKLYFKTNEDKKTLQTLQKKNLEQQLEYLKYQINPHFLMNTLNNIHALVDIDPERAKEMIVIMSRLMRHMLYEGSKSKIPLQREVDFLQNYTELMRIRYTDHVDITLTLPDRLPDAQIPPLLFITFVENAFKHGVSYRQQSFIRISLHTEGQRLHFLCTNSKREDTGQHQTENLQGGMGLNNIRQRLTLLYGSDYQLEMNDGPDTYDVHLCLPLS